MTSGLVSVLVSTRNRANTLEHAIRSVLRQDHPDVELVIVDDASNDETPDILEEWRADARITVVRNERQLGLPASLNWAASVARGTWFARIDDDDAWVDQNKLTAQLDWFEAHPTGVLVGTGYRDEQDRSIRNPAADDDIRQQMLFRCPFCHSSVLFRKDAFVRAGGYDESMPYAEDWELWMRLGRLGVLGNLDRVSVVKAAGEDTMSARYFRRQLGIASELTERYAEDYPRATRARWFHRFSRFFFSTFPVNGYAHLALSRVFRRSFDLES